MRQLELGIGSSAELLDGVDRCALAGRGPNYATAFEAALKIKELTGIAAEPYSPADLMHGPVAVLGPGSPLIAFALAGPAVGSIVEAEREAAERGATRLALTDAPEAGFAAGCRLIPVVAVAEWLSPLVAILPAQALAAQAALRRGLAVDTPFGLSKVTRSSLRRSRDPVPRDQPVRILINLMDLLGIELQWSRVGPLETVAHPSNAPQAQEKEPEMPQPHPTDPPSQKNTLRRTLSSALVVAAATALALTGAGVAAADPQPPAADDRNLRARLRPRPGLLPDTQRRHGHLRQRPQDHRHQKGT